MTLAELRAQLSEVHQSASLVFATEQGPIGRGYHVTEFKLAQVQSIDCGAQRSAWTEATMQLLDGDGDDHLLTGRFTRIADQSMAALDGLSDLPLRVEFANGNQGLRIYEIGNVEAHDGQVTVALTDQQAVCKPAMARAVEAQACCAPKVQQGCCG